MRLIDADKLKQELIELRTMAEYKEGVNSYAYAALKYAVVCVINAPTIEAEPVRHGDWLYNDIYLPNCAECSECGWRSSVRGDEIPSYHYCPNCGAKMDGGD